jgi:hypothetical protein
MALLLSLNSLSAGLIEADHPVFGPKSLTIDTGSQLAWLDLSSSVNYSYLQVESASQAGGLFAGFRHATTDEVFGLYQHAGIFSLGDHPGNDTAIASLIGLLGATSFDAGRPEVLGISATPALATTRSVPMLDFYFRHSSEGSVPLYDVSLQRLALSEAAAEPTVGHWLVMVVPEPSSAAVFALGVVLTGLGRLKGGRGRIWGDNRKK